MTIQQLQYFVAVVKHNNITKAAKSLYVSQPAISLAIKELEKEFDTNLFVRYNNQLVLTDEGHHLYKLATGLLNEYDNVIENMNGYIKKSSILKIGVPPMLGSFLLPSLIQKYTAAKPNVEIQLIELGSAANQRALLDREITCSFTVKHKDNIDSNLDYIKVANTALFFAINKNNPLAKHSEISIKDIKNTPLILMKEDSLQSHLIQEEFKKNKVEPNIKIRTNQLYTIKELIIGNNLGAFLFTQVFQYDNDDDLVLIPLKDPLEFDIILAWEKHSQLNDATKDFINFVKSNKFTTN